MTDATSRLSAALEGRYRVERELGEGGMATVYLARDEKHNRSVALKVLKPELAAVVGADRFLAEIETTANLQHPHILPLFDSGEADGFLFYVMPYVEGESLRDRLDRERQLPVDEAVQIATNVAEALDSAHRRGVIHRDIKPANILLLDGKPVISDFGIALAVSVGGGSRLTETGLSLGTPHYMSPEQATGDVSVGSGTDVYALGCVLYEMLVGEPPYTGSTAQAILGKIIHAKPVSATELRRSVPAHVDAAIRRALEKLPADRFASASELARALGDASFRHGEVAGVGVGSASAGVGPWKRLTVAGWSVAALFALALAGELLTAPSEVPAADGLEGRFTIGTGAAKTVGMLVGISRDGSLVAFAGLDEDGERLLFVRSRSEVDAVPVPGTENGTSPFFSPDNEWLAFTRGVALERVRLGGGVPQTIAPAPGVAPNTISVWSDDDWIYHTSFANGGGLGRVPAAGGEVQMLIGGMATPSFLNEDGSLLFTRWDGLNNWPERLLPDGTVELLGEFDARTAQVVGGNTLVFGRRDGSVLAADYDPETGEVGATTVMVA